MPSASADGLIEQATKSALSAASHRFTSMRPGAGSRLFLIASPKGGDKSNKPPTIDSGSSRREHHKGCTQSPRRLPFFITVHFMDSLIMSFIRPQAYSTGSGLPIWMAMARGSALLACCIFATLASPARDIPPQDHGGADLILADGDRIWGDQTGIRRFEVPAGALVRLHQYFPSIPGSGQVHVSAEEIVVAGELNAEGCGYTGGGGQGGAGVYNSVDARRGADGAPRYLDYTSPPSTWPYAYGDGPAAGPPFAFFTGLPSPVGGYNVSGRNTDETTDSLVLMGSGGGGGSSWNEGGESRCNHPGLGYHGGTSGGAGGGAIRLMAKGSLLVSGRILTASINGRGGTAGKRASAIPNSQLPFFCTITGGDGGNGGSCTSVIEESPPSARLGSGGGGGVLLMCESDGGLTVTGTVDCRSTRSTSSTSTNGGVLNGGTLKIFYNGQVTLTGSLRGGRVYRRNTAASTNPELLQSGWVFTGTPRSFARPAGEEATELTARQPAY